jgi:hypothetical protein
MGAQRRVEALDPGRSAGVLAAASVLFLLAVVATTADAKCWKPICREGFHFDGKRCVDTTKATSGAGSRYDPPRPACGAGWSVQGQYCLEDGCCTVPVCGNDEVYEHFHCKSASAQNLAPTTRPAACAAGWSLLPGPSGLCQKRNCPPISVRGHTALPCVDLGGAVTIYGENFGAAQGDRRLAIHEGVYVFLEITAWDDTAISFVVPARGTRIAAGREYPVVLFEGQRPGQPLVRVRICGALQ